MLKLHLKTLHFRKGDDQRIYEFNCHLVLKLYKFEGLKTLDFHHLKFASILT